MCACAPHPGREGKTGWGCHTAEQSELVQAAELILAERFAPVRTRAPNMVSSGAAAEGGASPAGHPPQQDAGEPVNYSQRQSGTSEGEHFPLEGRKGRKSAEDSRHEERTKVRVKEILAVEQDQQRSDEERTCNVDHEGCQRKTPIVFFIHRERDEVAGQRPYRPTAENEKAAQEQTTILAWARVWRNC
jgi:hypothetical protein